MNVLTAARLRKPAPVPLPIASMAAVLAASTATLQDEGHAMRILHAACFAKEDILAALPLAIARALALRAENGDRP